MSDDLRLHELSTRFTLIGSQLTRASDDEAAATLIADLQDATSDLIDLMAARRPRVIALLARLVNVRAFRRFPTRQEASA